MCDPVSISLTVTALAGGIGAVGAYNQGQVAQQVGRNNQIMAEYAAKDAEARGEQDAIAARRRGDQLAGTQRARLAANGLDLTEGTPAEILDQTSFFSQTDQATARTNGRREAWSDRAGGANARAQGDAAAANGTLGAFATILGTGGQVAEKWYPSAAKPTQKQLIHAGGW